MYRKKKFSVALSILLAFCLFVSGFGRFGPGVYATGINDDSIIELSGSDLEKLINIESQSLNANNFIKSTDGSISIGIESNGSDANNSIGVKQSNVDNNVELNESNSNGRIESDQQDSDVNLSVESSSIEDELDIMAEGIFVYSVSDDVATLMRCDEAASGDIIIPDTIGGYPVTQIGKNAFFQCINLESICIPDSVTDIDNFAFTECTKLESITLPDSLQIIGAYAFDGCTGLKSIALPDSLQIIGAYAFDGCTGLKSITLPNNITYIDMCTFIGCTSLESISIPDSVTYIRLGAFLYCESLKTIRIPDSVTYLSSEVFSGCSNLTSIIIPNKIAEIGPLTFHNCYILQSVMIPNSVKSISECAFQGCSSNLIIHCEKDSYAETYAKENGIKFITMGGDNPIITESAIKDSDPSISYIPQNTDITIKGENDINSIFTSRDLPSYSSNKISKQLPDVPGNVDIKDMDLNLNGYNLTIHGSIKVENAEVRIPSYSTLNVRSIELGANGKIIVDGILNCEDIMLCGGNKDTSGGYLETRQNGRVNAQKVSMKDYSTMKLDGKLTASGDFLIQTKSNQSNFTSDGVLWLGGNFTQKNNGLLLWMSGNDNFTPQNGFTIVLENTDSGNHKLSFATPKSSYIYNLFIDRGPDGSSDNNWTGNPEIKGVIKGVYKTSTAKGYAELRGNTQNTKQFIRQFRQDIASSMKNIRNTASVGFGVEELGAFNSESNEALKSYLFTYISSVKAIYPSIFDVAWHNWEIKIPIDGEDIQFNFSDVKIYGQRFVEVKYTYKNSKNQQCFLFMFADAEELANSIKKYALDQYRNVMCDYFRMPLDEYVASKNSLMAELIYEGVRLVPIEEAGIKGSKEVVSEHITTGLDWYLNRVASSIKTGATRTSQNVFLMAEPEFQQALAVPRLASQTAQPELEKSTVQNGMISFADEYLEYALRENISASAPGISVDMLSTIETLDLSEKYITNISGLEYCTNLKSLDLSGNSVYDITPLSALNHLAELDLSGNIVQDVSGLSGLTNLKRLLLTSNRIQDISALSELTSLEELSVSYNNLEDISALSGLGQLKSLNLTNNALIDIGALNSLSDLNILYCGRNNISSIANIGDLQLEIFDISSNDLSDISSLDVINLQKLNISDNQIGNILTLQDASRLTYLDICDNMITSIESVGGSELEELRINNNMIEDIGAVASMNQLKVFECADNMIEDYTILQGNMALEKLNIQGGNINDFSFVAPLTKLTTLNMSNCGVFGIDLMYLSEMSDLATLDVSVNQICDMSAIGDLENLSDLNLSGNIIDDLSPLLSLNELKNLNISDNPYISQSENGPVLSALESSNAEIINQQISIATDGIYFMEEAVNITKGAVYEQSISCIPLSAAMPELSWSSSDESVAAVADGIVTGVDFGTATITAFNSDSEFTASFDVTVLENMTPIQYTVTFQDWDGTVLKKQEVKPGETVSAPDVPARIGYTFNGWFTAATGGTQVMADAVFTADITLHAQWTVNSSNGNNSNSGSSGGTGVGGGSNSSSNTVAVTTGDGSVQVNYSAVDGEVSLQLPAGKVEEIIAESADNEAVIDASGISGATSAELPRAALGAFADAGLGLSVKLPAGTLVLSEEMTATLLAQMEGDKLRLELKAADMGALTDAQNDAVQIGENVFDINIFSGAVKIGGFDGTLTVQVPYSGENPAVWFLDDAGGREKLESAFQDGVVSFRTDHLSVYVIGEDDEATPENVDWGKSFRDILPTAWYYAHVRYAYENGLMSGMADGFFSPHVPLTRGMIVTVLYKMENSPDVSALDNSFSDVAGGQWYADAVKWAAANGIVSGVGGGRYAPNADVTRQDMAVILTKYMQLKGTDIPVTQDRITFADEDQIAAYAANALQLLNKMGVINGIGENENGQAIINPKGIATRAQVAAMLHSFIEETK